MPAESEPFHLVLHQPVIPQNTGSIARLCACTGATLHLIHPLGFSTDDAAVKRAGLDYWEHVDIREYPDWKTYLKTARPEHLFLFSKFAANHYTEARFPPGSHFVFGSETEGLPSELREEFPTYKIPMRTHLVRSLNLSQCCAVILYEGLRQSNTLC